MHLHRQITVLMPDLASMPQREFSESDAGCFQGYGVQRGTGPDRLQDSYRHSRGVLPGRGLLFRGLGFIGSRSATSLGYTFQVSGYAGSRGVLPGKGLSFEVLRPLEECKQANALIFAVYHGTGARYQNPRNPTN
jgi:hypothetical protein